MTNAGDRRIEICLGMLCNNRCVFCMSSQRRDSKEAWMRPEKVFSELDHFYQSGCRSLGFLGGEPTAYPHLLACVEHARRLGYTRIALCTNGTRLSNPDFCRRLVDAGLTRVSLSVHSHLASVEDGLITRVPGNLKRKLKALDNLVALRSQNRLKDNVSLNPVLSRVNLPSMEQYIAFYTERELWDIRFNFIWPNGEVIRDRRWIPSYTEAIREIVRVALRSEKKPRLRLTFGGVPACVLRHAGLSDRMIRYLAGKYLDEAAFDPANDVSAPRADGGNPGRFVWQEQKRDGLKTMAPACASCRYHQGCEGVWKTYGDMYGFDEFTPL